MTDEEKCGAPTSKGTPCENSAESCPWHTEDPPETGRQSKIDDSRPDLLEAAELGMTIEGCARYAGIGTTTLYDWMDEYPEFSKAFNRARAKGEKELVKEVTQRNPQFILERSYSYTKTQEIEHSGDGISIDLGDSAGEWKDDE